MSLFIGNLSRNISLKELEEQFNKFGPCKINHRVALTQGGYAFVEYINDHDAEEAMKALVGKNLGGLCLNIEWSKRSPKFTQKEANGVSQNKEKLKDRCFKCGKPGHISRDCQEGMECYECKGYGHIARDCPKQNKRKSPKNKINSPKRSRSPRRSSSERSFSIERADLPNEYMPRFPEAKDFDLKPVQYNVVKQEFVNEDKEEIREIKEENREIKEEIKESENELIMEDGSKFKLISGDFNEETAIFRCMVCEKNMQRSSTRRHIGTKTHNEKLIK
ncbi:unnamed protein product [Blepharisma stoltei]|uniref:RNA-binding protein n=1 Tax=Blepharisma stoltei TaxID=1481888 RepID=A0AAU9IXE6_9CILI|nr:unnamed protein product [Blepharisma stoltei]